MFRHCIKVYPEHRPQFPASYETHSIAARHTHKNSRLIPAMRFLLIHVMLLLISGIYLEFM